MEITNRQGLPEAIVKAVSTEQHNKTADELSATTLLKGIKQIHLERRHWDEMKDDAADRIWAVWGEAVHILLEKEAPEEFAECKLSVKVPLSYDGEFTITGRIDNYNMKTGIVSDYKTASTWKVLFNDFEDWRMQGLVYAWLLYKNNFMIKKCRFIALLKDHSKSKAKRDSRYPQSPVYIKEYDITENSLKEAENFVMQRLTEYLKYIAVKDDEIPPCTAQERWADETTYAVMKKGRKTAVKVCTNPIEANDFVVKLSADHYVEIRQGTSKKCNDYCICKDYCNFYNNVVKQQGAGEE